MNKENSDIINKTLLIGDKLYMRHKQRINEFMKDRRLSHIAKNKLDAACFQQDSAYNKRKDSVNRKQSDIVLKNKL